MKITALKNFKANGVEGYPGKVLSIQEISSIVPVLEEMKAEQMILVEQELETPPDEELSGQGMVDEGPDADDGLGPNSPEDVKEEAPEEVAPSDEAPQKAKKKKH